jgi:metallo-beta-lactamase class B
MKRIAYALLIALSSTALCAAHAEEPSWSQPQKPFRIYGNTYYVGTVGLSAILIASPQGDILIDGTLPQNAPLIEANIRALGFRVRDIRVILNSHAHPDHAGAIAELARASGAQVYASTASVRALTTGGDDPEDPLYGDTSRYPAIAHVSVVRDGETIHVGDNALTAHYTPGHTPGGTSWSWRSCEHDQCLNMVYADSLAAISRDGFRFTDDAIHPHRVEDFRHSLTVVAALPCDILMVPHPDAIGFMDKVAARNRGQRPDPLIDTRACQAYAAAAGARLDARLAQERHEGGPH